MISDGRQVKMGTHGRTLMRGAAVAVVAVGIIAAGGATLRRRVAWDAAAP